MTRWEYATVQVVSMDGQPIAASKKLLVQVGTTERLTEFATRPAEFEHDKQKVKGEEITNTGHPPKRHTPATRSAFALNDPMPS